MPDQVQLIHKALEAGDKQAAQELLRPLLKTKPSAETWYLAALACTSKEKALACVERALALDPAHRGANRLLTKMGQAQPDVSVLTSPLPPAPAASELPDVWRKSKKKRRGVRPIVLLSILLFGMCCSLITMNMIGVISGPITAVTMLTGGATPVTQIDGVPLSQVENAPMKVQPSQTEPLEGRDADVIEPGYEHEYTFDGGSGTEVAIYVQFLSVAANRVSRNVVVVRPDGSNATANCQRDVILEGDNNIAFTCLLDASGEWKLRILGREGESVGAYFVGVEQMGV